MIKRFLSIMQLKKKLNDKQVALNDEIFVGVQLLYSLFSLTSI